MNLQKAAILRTGISLTATVVAGAGIGFLTAGIAVPACLAFEHMWETHRALTDAKIEWGYVALIACYTGLPVGGIAYPFIYHVLWRRQTPEQRITSTAKVAAGTIGLALLGSPMMEFADLVLTLLGFAGFVAWATFSGQRSINGSA